MKTLKDFDFKNKRVLVRCDFNVPLSDKGEILDDFRIKESVPTTEYLIKKGAKVILMSHLGRPEGKVVERLRLKPVAQRLEKLLGQKINLLENLRFNPGEKLNNESFAKELAEKGDIYINDAFGACHRAHASIVGIPKFLPAGAGFLLEKEIRILSDLMQHSKKPLVAIIGGAKVETKAKLINKLLQVADCILVNPLMGKTSNKIIAPLDVLDSKKDIGEKTIKLFKEKIAEAKTILWNGPLGLIEDERFSKGTAEIARAIAQSNAFSVVGGGETVEFINKLGLIKKFNHVSTGGGAMLAFLSGEKLPGLEALKGVKGVRLPLIQKNC